MRWIQKLSDIKPHEQKSASTVHMRATSVRHFLSEPKKEGNMSRNNKPNIYHQNHKIKILAKV